MRFAGIDIAAETHVHEYPTAEAFLGLPWKRLARLCCDGRHKVGEELAKGLGEAAKTSVGRHHGPPYRVQVRCACEDLDRLRRRLRELDSDVARTLDDPEVPTLTAVRESAWLRAYCEGLRARGMLPKVALVAAMRKLLVAVYLVAEHRKPFVPILAEARA